MMRVGYLGPPGTFSEEALRASARGALGATAGEELVEVALPTVHAVVEAVQDGQVDRAITPIENSLEGSVNEALDALVHDAPDVRIVGETVLKVRYVLAARPGVALEDVRSVLSHPQALAQCAAHLRERLPAAPARACTSTAEAMRLVAAGDEPWAALGSALAADAMGLVALERGIGDEEVNATRFVWLARGAAGAYDDVAGDPATCGGEGSGEADRHGGMGGLATEPGAPWKTSVVFSGDGDGHPGWLVRCLSEFAFRGVNLTRIESRPARRRLGHYLFLVDLEGRSDLPGPAAEAIAALTGHCEDVRVLGSYPRLGA